MDSTKQKARGRGRAWWALLATVAAFFAWNLSLTIPVAAALSKDPRNEGVALVAYRSYGVLPSVTLDLWAFDPEKSPADLCRALFQAADQLKSRSFSRVTLARAGKAIFVLKGEDFQELGAEFDGGQNPIYLLRTLPEKLYLPNGKPAFGTWEGGLLGVLTKQMDDLTAFTTGWLLGRQRVAAVD